MAASRLGSAVQRADAVCLVRQLKSVAKVAKDLDRVLAVSVRIHQECAARRPRRRRGPLGMSWSQPRLAADVVQAVCGAAAAFSFAAEAASFVSLRQACSTRPRRVASLPGRARRPPSRRSMNSTTESSLTAAASQFCLWRSARRRGERIPAELWRAARAAAQQHGVSRTSLALGVDYDSLRRRLDELLQVESATRKTRVLPSPPSVPIFVELPTRASGPTLPVACTIALERSNADSTTARMRIELRGITTAELAHLVERWSHRS